MRSRAKKKSNHTMIIDCHAHIFNAGVIENVARKKNLGERLHLELDQAHERLGVKTLEGKMKAAGVDACLALPTASAESVKKVNKSFIKTAESSEYIYTAGTLHPDYAKNKDELKCFKTHGIRAIKLCSFSQGFALNSKKTIDLFDMIRDENRYNSCGFFVVLDTYYNASVFFGTPGGNDTTPALLGDLVKNYPEIKFIGAHMGGLDAPFEEIRKYLIPAENLYMDTSNAAHTLDKADFIRLIRMHGHEHIAFGTDWPWFGYAAEIDIIQRLLNDAGLSEKQKASVFRGNIAKLLGIE